MLIHPQPRQKAAGVTLIELMISIVLLSLLVSFALPSFSTWIQNAQIRTSAESIQNGLNLVRTEAVRRNALTSLVFTNTLPTVGNINSIVADKNGSNWVARVLPAEGEFTAEDFIQGRSGMDGSPNVAVNAVVDASDAPQATITFNSLGRVSPAPESDITIEVTNSAGGTRPLTVLVTQGGQIRICDPALPATNVQSC